MKPSLHRLGVLILSLACCLGANAAEHLRPPAVPLVAHDPYFSIWSPADKLTDADTMHWTGKPHQLASFVQIDGKAFRIMGTSPTNVPALPQTSLEVLPTRTIYTFEGEGVRLTLTFMTPALPDDLDVLSRPVTYVTYTFTRTDDRTHEIQPYLDVSASVAVNAPDQEVVWGGQWSEEVSDAWVGSKQQQVLSIKGDDLRIDWGRLYAAAPSRFLTHLTVDEQGFLLPNVGVGAFKERPALNMPQSASRLVASCCFLKTPVASEPVSRWLMLAYDDEYSIKYFRQNLRPYWRRHGDDAAALLKKAAADYESLKARCEKFDAELMADLRKVGGEKYAQLCALAYRQTFAGNKIIADANGQPLMFPKENFSNGCIGTVDVLFPQAPFFLVLSPALTKAMLVPILDYAASPRWPYDYAPHDLGTYPHATGQVYGMGGKDGDRMPVEESGNMLIMLAALAKQEGTADFSKPYWPMLTKWVDYLVKEGLDPQNQLCSADMFGHLPRNANLALKAIIGIGGFAQLCELAGKPDDAKKYFAIARDYAAKWQELAKGEGRTVLAYGQPGTWAMKHNLIWDRVLGLNLVLQSIGDAEVAWYLKVQKKYGLPVDNRTDTSLIDWALWSIALARNDADFQALLEPIWRYANETPSRVPFSDWFVTTDARQKGFQARPVVGGLCIKMLADPAMWQKWARRGTDVSGLWAPIPIGGATREVVSTAKTAPVKWRYTLGQPAENWTKPGFDDSTWSEGTGGFGTKGTPGAIIGTEWKTKEIWLRREFALPDRALKNPRLLLIYDEDPEVYLNGVLAAKLSGWRTEYDEADIAPAAFATLKPGNNLLAVRASQTYGGQCIDVGLMEEAARLPVRKLIDHPVRDTSVCIGPDGMYYLTGTTGAKTGGAEAKDGWWYVNEGIRVWRSPDLTNWAPLGLVWSFDKDATWQKPLEEGRRALWAPEIHHLKGTFWLTYCLNWKNGGTGLLKSTSGRADGPYVDVKPDGPITSEIDAALFQDDDGKVYFVFQDGKIARMNDDMTGLAENPRLLKPANFKHVGFEGAFLTRMNGRYTLVCAEFNPAQGGDHTYDCMVAHADSIYGPYGDRYLALPTAGHNMFFQDKRGQWWATYFGNDPQAVWRERPGILPIQLDASGKIVPVSNPPQP